MQEFTTRVCLQQTKQELSIRNMVPKRELCGTGCHWYRIQRSGSLKFAVQCMKKKWIMSKDHLAGNNSSYSRCAGKQDSKESNLPSHLETAISLGNGNIFMLHFPTPQGNKIKQPLWFTAQPIDWDSQVNIQHLTQKNSLWLFDLAKIIKITWFLLYLIGCNNASDFL